jgi:hypothetical protein
LLKIVLRFSVATGTGPTLFSTRLLEKGATMPTHPRIRRALAGAAMAAVVAAGVAVGTSEAAGSGSGSPPVKSVSGPAAPSNVLAGVRAALDRLAADGTITAAQAAAVQSQADAGSINSKVLVDHGVLTDAQMRAVAAALDQVKRAAAGG